MAIKNPSDMLDAPIPGMSLTAEPKSRPWQRPPQYVELDDVVSYYLERAGNENAINRANFILENDRIPVNLLVDTLITSGMMEGIHTVAMGALVAPVLREFIIANAEIAEIDFVKSSEEFNKGKLIDPVEKRMFAKALREDMLSDIEGASAEMPMAATEEMVEEKPMGLMQRPSKPPVEEMM